MTKINERLLHTVQVATSAYHCIEEAKRQLLEAGYQQLELNGMWELERGNGYFINVYDSSFIAFDINEEFEKEDGIRMGYAHTDFPGLRVKANPDIIEGKYGKLNVEVYGGPILSSYFDRPLSLSGRVILRGNSIMEPIVRLIDFNRPLLTIPNLAPHLDREGNKGKEYNRQVDLLPLIRSIHEQMEQEALVNLIANELKVESKDILDYDLGVYCFEQGCRLGSNQEFISAPRLDNLTSVQACITGLIESNRKEGINMIACFDHEEVGSRSKKGAGSMILSIVLEKIYASFGYDKLTYTNALLSSACLSLDVAHAMHPNKKEKSDITSPNYLNDGVVIKCACSQSYATEGVMVGILVGLCEKYDIPYQKYFNRSDIAGGSTLGAIISAILPIPTQDIGVPLLAMHSARELMGASDQEQLERVMTAFFEEK